MRKKIKPLFGKSRPPFQIGIIDVGAHTLRMDIYEVDKKWSIHLLESISRSLNLGQDVFRTGLVSPGNIERLVEMLGECQLKLLEYGIVSARVVATSAIREAFNRDLVVDRLREAGVELEILEGAQEVTLTYLTAREVLADYCRFEKMRAMILIIGTGSLFVALADKGLMRFCEEIPTGTLRISDAFGASTISLDQLTEILRSQDIVHRLSECVDFDPKEEMSLVLIGASARKLAELWGRAPDKNDDCVRFGAAKAKELLVGSPDFNLLSQADNESVAATREMVRFFFRELNFSEILFPGVNTRSALVWDITGKLRHPDKEPFCDDLLAICDAVGRKYGFDSSHAKTVVLLSEKLLDKLQRLFQFPPRSKLLLAAAASLHDIGRFVDARQHHRHSWYLIRNTQLPGFTAQEHLVVAAIARYHRKSLPRESHVEYSSLTPEDRVTVMKLSAILRVADALDSARNRRFCDMKIVQRGKTIQFQVSGNDFRTEKFYLKLKGDLFEQVYGLSLKIQE